MAKCKALTGSTVKGLIIDLGSVYDHALAYIFTRLHLHIARTTIAHLYKQLSISIESQSY